MPASSVPLPLRALPADDLLGDLLAVSMTGAIYYTPLYAPDGSGVIVDFTFVYLNPTAQRMMRMPEVPAVTHNQQWPHSIAHGTFAFHVDAYLSGEPRTYNINYQADGYDNYYRLAARRSGDGLWVSFTDTADQPRSPVEVALRQAQAAEKAARAEAEAERQRLHQVLMRMPANIALLRGPEHVYERVNTEYQRLFPGRSVLGRTIREVIPEIEGQGFFELLDRVYESGEPFYQAEAEAWADYAGIGELQRRYYRTTFEPIRNAEGEVTEILNFAVDVTSQVEARQQVEALNQELEARVQARTQLLRQAQADAHRRRLQRLLAEAPIMIASLRGPEHYVELANDDFRQVFGGRPLAGKLYREAVPELAGQSFFGLLDQVYRTGNSHHAYEQLAYVDRHNTGQTEPLYFSYTYQATRDAAGLVDGVLIVATDVTEQVRARQRTEEAAAELRLLAAHTPAFLFRTDAAGRLTYLNDSFFEWTGLDRAALPTLDASWDALHPDDGGPVYQSFLASLSSGQTWVSPPYRFRRRDGQYRWCLSRTQPYMGLDGKVSNHSGLTVEIHEQVELQRQLARTNVDLDNFIYTASHDLKQPIANIEGLLQALEHELPPAARVGEVSNMLQLMQVAIERFGRTINHLTDISRLQHEHNQPAAPVALARVVHEVQLDLAPLLAQTQARVDVRIPDDATLHISEKSLRSVVYNLLSNALKFRHPHRVPEVAVSYAPRTGGHVLAVQDNGLGLDLAQDQGKVFGMFQRLHPHVEGSGVGLYMVKRIVENTGGRIEVESEPGQGSTFRVYFSR